MKNEELLTKLIKIKSESGNEKGAGEYIYNRLKKDGFKILKQVVNNKSLNFNIFAYVGKPTIIFSNHIDTVSPQISIGKNNTKIFGRGSCDNKSQVAAIILAAENAINDGLANFGLLFTVQEESDFAGAKKAVSLIPNDCKLVVIGEPTDLKVINGHNGILVIELIAKGKTAHGSIPEKGINAIELLIDDLLILRKTDFGNNRILGKNILNIAKISGGTADNIVPDSAKAVVAYRTVIKSSKVLAKIKSVIKSKINVIFSYDPFFNANANKIAKIIKTKTCKVRYFTEASILQKNANVIIIGAGSINQAHSKNESVSIKEYKKLIDMYYKIIKYCKV